MSVLNVLKSDGFRLLNRLIRFGFLSIAEAELMRIEVDHAIHENEYTTEENALIEQAIQICWNKITEKRRFMVLTYRTE